ncbi:uncharacterized protein LOC129244684 isoform X1 [Anastrepha obliqua]|uniref:uncharacterized protein LOC129244684 isoform X1 n=2 Tax=Anastrepha obliqua TaxID=95512 RepID=UPI00240A698E|nr:uncharacterized protein LOC129244684 isoform X1 [Anastrepha obliqua]XP_054738433.1 uncharacterized protein LOC129244684 isoform X1 [Anastrepha obliqua]
MSAQKRSKINNSYESEPSSSSSLNEQLEYNVVYDESMHLPYILKPPSYETEVVIPADGNFIISSQENKIPFIAMSSSLPGMYEEQSPPRNNKTVVSPTLSQKSAFKGFGESPYGKLQREFFSSTYDTRQATISLEKVSPHTLTDQKNLPTNGGTVFSRFYDMVVDENSCNAVDIQLSNEKTEPSECDGDLSENGVDYLVALSKRSETIVGNPESKPFELSTDLSFNGKIKSLTPPIEYDGHETIIEIRDKPLNHSFVLKKYSNEKSPDLFGDDEDDENENNTDTGNENIYSFNAEDLIEVVDTTVKSNDTIITEKKANEMQEDTGLPESITVFDVNACENRAEHNADASTNKSLNCATESSLADDQTCEQDSQRFDTYSLFRENCRREKELLRRIRKCLAGVPPPPSVTIPQLDMFSAVMSRKQDILDFTANIDTTDVQDSWSSSNEFASLLKPTHSVDESAEMGWRQVLAVRQHGFCFNLCKASENNEYLGLSVIERFIGAETASSYRNSPSSEKKRNARMKLLTQSPGNRLSHLARRRATFSSAQLATQKSNSLRGPQIVVDVKKKNKHRRKNTPKRMTPGSKKKTRKTPSSSARKRQFRCDLIKPGPSREASKRALFQSPPKQLQHKPPVQRCMLSIKPEIANRVEKSKRALFSPDKQTESAYAAANQNLLLGIDKSLNTQFDLAQKQSRFSTLEFDSRLKRKRSAIDDDDTGDLGDLPSQSSKLFRGGAENLTPRALKIKSQSFCIGAGSTSTMASAAAFANSEMTTTAAVSTRDLISHTNLLPTSSFTFGSATALSSNVSAAATTSKIQRSHSEMVAQSNSLTENQRKKLLWAVSQALQEKKITTKHSSFKQYAAVLARVVRRLFQEFFQKSSTSNSETLLRLAKRYVHNVITGHCADDIYLQAKAKIVREKNESNCRLSGYIGPEEYQRLKNSQQQQLQDQTHSFSQNLIRADSVTNIFSIDSSLNSSRASSSQNITLSTSSLATTSTSQNQSQIQLLESTVKQSSSLTKLSIQSNTSLQNSSSKNNMCGLALRENVNFESDQRRSAQKNFTGKDQRNVSPYAQNNNHYFGNQLMSSNMQGASVKCTTSVGKSQLQAKNIELDSSLLNAGTTKVKRQISFDN